MQRAGAYSLPNHMPESLTPLRRCTASSNQGRSLVALRMPTPSPAGIKPSTVESRQPGAPRTRLTPRKIPHPSCVPTRSTAAAPSTRLTTDSRARSILSRVPPLPSPPTLDIPSTLYYNTTTTLSLIPTSTLPPPHPTPPSASHLGQPKVRYLDDGALRVPQVAQQVVALEVEVHHVLPVQVLHAAGGLWAV